jgi:hypothetical protein
VASYELLDGTRNYTRAGSVVRGTRCFIIDGYQHTALLDPIIPPRDSPYEFAPGSAPKAYARSFNVELYTPTQCKVTVTYDNDGSTRGPQLPDDQDPSYKDINITFTRDTEKIPSFMMFQDVFGIGRDANGVPDGSGPYDYNERWEPYDFTVDVYYGTAEVTVNLPSMTSRIQADIATQVNHIHKFPDGVFWQFIGATTTRKAEDQWEITYRWIHDPGQEVGFTNPIISTDYIILPDDTKEFVTLPIDADRNLVTAGSIMVPTISRGPFEKWRVIPASFPGDRPTITVTPFDAFRYYQPLGYQLLPGNPIP